MSLLKVVSIVAEQFTTNFFTVFLAIAKKNSLRVSVTIVNFHS